MRRLTNAETKQAIASGGLPTDAEVVALSNVPDIFWEVCKPNRHGGEELILVSGSFDAADRFARESCCWLYSIRSQVDGSYVRRLESQYWSADMAAARWEVRS
jgi:hypothetical protein